jgi:hypothetical protein
MAEIPDETSAVMKAYAEPKPLGTATFEPIRYVRYLDEEDVFEVEFESGETFCVSHSAIRQANPLANSFGAVDSVWIEAELRAGFLVRYTTGDLADCAWDFVKESA